MSTFRQRIRKSIADEHLQVALDGNAERRIRVRKDAFASLPDAQDMRQQAHALRAEVIDHLDTYLDQFIQQAQAHGMVVHRAAGARQALEKVLEIARGCSAQLVAKSKTMISEEIHLNHTLEENGLRVVETDLGEYIVQLREETPSHIITPAVHLTRKDVGRLFEEKLGLPYTEDIPLMTAAARRVLREVFLNADIGISGVNFAVAETGTLCVLTNEGNGRMVTTLPRVHIALLGMERLVPTMDDLALMLRLLPRSATGQKLTVYTSLLNGPRVPQDPDGPQERHVIILDNGRSQLRASPLREMLYCIRCGACLNACPVFREIGGHAYGSPYPGPMGSVLSPALFGQAAFGQLARASSLCGACREVCPVDIDLPRLLLRVRAGMTDPNPLGTAQARHSIPNPPTWLGMGLQVFTWAAENPGRFRLAQRLAGMLPGGPGWLRLPAWSGWGLSKDFPKPAKSTFHQRWAARGNVRRSGEAVVRSDHASAAGGMQLHPAPARPVEEVALMSQEDRLCRFQAELEALGARLIRCEPVDVASQVHQLLQERGCQDVLTWEPQQLPDGMLESLQWKGIRVVHPTAETKMEASQVRAGLTGAIGAVIETGSIAIAGGAGRPLMASLLPEIHIVILRKEKVWMHLEEVLHLSELCQASASTLVSGPSRTADIEMTLTIGVHGPGELIVIVC